MWRLLLGDQFRELYERKEAARRAFVGIHVLHSHALLLRDPALIRRIFWSKTSPNSRTALRAQMRYEIQWAPKTYSLPNIRLGGRRIRSLLYGLQKFDRISRLIWKKKLNGAESVELEVKQLCALFTTDIFAKFAESRGRVSSNVYWSHRPKAKALVTPPIYRVRTHLYSEEYERFMRKSMNYVLAQRAENWEKRYDLIDMFLQMHRTETAEGIIHRPDFYVAQAAFCFWLALIPRLLLPCTNWLKIRLLNIDCRRSSGLTFSLAITTNLAMTPWPDWYTYGRCWKTIHSSTMKYHILLENCRE